MARGRSTRLARLFLVLAAISGLLILVDFGGIVATLAKGSFFLFAIVSLYFIASGGHSDPRARAS